jgi:hypothetical protein
MTVNNNKSIEAMYRQKAALEAFISGEIQKAAGGSTITRQPITGPDWPQRKDYPNRAAFRKACAEWRKEKRHD